MNSKYYFVALMTMAVVTYLIRAVPFGALQTKVQNTFVRSFLYYVPYAVLAAMTFPAILGCTERLSASIAGLVVGVIAAYRGRSLMTVALVACGAALIVSILPLG